MSFSICLRCLSRSIRPNEASIPAKTAPRASFSTTPARFANPPKKKAGVANVASRQGGTLRLSKNTRSSTGRPPAPGERKAFRKKIVLSNPNALEVPGLSDLTGDKLVYHGDVIGLEMSQGKVLGLTENVVEALSASEAFKATQRWNLFRRPASLVRRETVGLAEDLARVEESKTTSRRLVFGNPASGKSVLMLQAQAMAFLKGWVVLHVPEAQELTNAHTSYQPVNTQDGIQYVQPHFTAKLLGNFARANQKVLSTLRISKQHELPIPVQSNISLSRFAEMGARDPDVAWPFWQALWSELTNPSQKEDGLQRPPVLVTIDGIGHLMRTTEYVDPEMKPIHAHELVLVKHLMDLFSGRSDVPNGGMVLCATCESNRASSPTLEFCLKASHAAEHNSKIGTSVPNTRSAADKNSADAPNLLPLPLPLPQWDPYVVKDRRVEAVMKDVQIQKLPGLSKDEARGIMEYYAQSGVLQANVTDRLVSEKWTLAGSGIIGELEKGSLGMGS